MYRPSYISLHSALSFYGIIPEEVVSITSVTTMKTNQFVNDFGTYTYQKVKRNLFFGYEPKLLQDGRAMLFATPEKAILDLLYLYSFYRTEQDMIELRFDDYFMQEDLDKDSLQNFLDRIKCKALDDRVKTMLKAYGI
jgi:predicted transcriptional regulator of viral defense system